MATPNLAFESTELNLSPDDDARGGPSVVLLKTWMPPHEAAYKTELYIHLNREDLFTGFVTVPPEYPGFKGIDALQNKFQGPVHIQYFPAGANEILIGVGVERRNGNVSAAISNAMALDHVMHRLNDVIYVLTAEATRSRILAENAQHDGR